MKRLIFILVLLYGTLSSSDFMAQVGGRKKEHRNQRRGGGLFKKKHSAGNADSFARGGGRPSKKSGRTPWAMRHSRPGIQKGNSQRSLFTRYRTNAKVFKQNLLDRQNAERARTRVRGSKVFLRKKYS